MIVYQLTVGQNKVILSLDAKDQIMPCPVAYQGNPSDVETVKTALSMSYGAYGHIINSELINVFNLRVALATSPHCKRFDAKLLEGKEILKIKPKPIPPGCMS